MIIGHCDGAIYMLEVIKKALPGTYVENPAPTSRIDVLIYSLFGDQHRKYGAHIPRIFICGEPTDVSRYVANILIDCKNVPRFQIRGATFCYLPFYVTSFTERFQNKAIELIKGPTYNPRQILATKSKFCAFLYSQQVDFRNRLYDTVSKYKPVDALGVARGKPGVAVDRRTYQPGKVTYNDLAVAKYRPYKFVIACENSQHPGYVTEKMISAMLANAIPLYLGAPDVAKHFNPASFIQVGSPGWEAKLKLLDEDDDAYVEMLAQPWLHNNVLNPYFDSNSILGPILKQIPKTVARTSLAPPPPAAYTQMRSRK
jgi:hypothetical protein